MIYLHPGLCVRLFLLQDRDEAHCPSMALRWAGGRGCPVHRRHDLLPYIVDIWEVVASSFSEQLVWLRLAYDIRDKAQKRLTCLSSVK